MERRVVLRGTIMVQGDLKQMSAQWLRGISLQGYGCSLAVGLGIPIPSLDEDMARFTGVSDRDIYTQVVDYGHDYTNGKTSLLLGLVDRPGSLNEVLTILSSKNINLAKIESRPVKGKQWTYLFFIDLLGHKENPVIEEACNILHQTCSYYEWLGSYPVAENLE